MEREKLLLVDSHSLIHQAYHAIGELRARDGTPTGAVYGFANMLLRVLEDERPTALGLAFDTPTPTFRHTQFADYKAHRPPLDEDLITQLPLVDALADAFRWPILKAPGYEADDILATLATRAQDHWDVYILTADRDLCQLVGPHVTVLATQARVGVPPERVPDYKGLAGDSSDNIPGVTGIGDKTATQLLQEYGDLEGVLAAADEMRGKRRENLLAQADIARLSRDLATVCREVPLDLSVEELRRREPDHEALGELFTRLEFHSLLRRLSPRTVTAPTVVHYRAVASDADAELVAREAAEARVVGLAWRDSPPALALSPGPGGAWLVPLETGGGQQMSLFAESGPDPAARARLETVLAPLAAGEARYVCHDAQRLYQALGAEHPALAALAGDTHLASWLLDPERPEHRLADLARTHVAAPPGPPPEGAPDPGLYTTCAEADLVRRLEPRLRELLDEESLLALYLEMELPLAPVLARMMARGVVLDRAAVAALDSELSAGVDAARRAVWAAAGREFTLDSPKQLAAILFDELGLQAGRKTKTGRSTDAAVLQNLIGEHPVVPAILEYRELAKLKSTYTEPLLALSDPVTSRIRTSLNQTGSATGRLSSSRPNLQNIPVRGNWGERFRNVFTAPDEWLLLAADYSQIELRVLAHVSGDERMIRAFREGQDIHTLAAAEIYGMAPEHVGAEQRRLAKVLNFGVAYGIQAHGLSQRLEIPRNDAQALIDAYFARFPAVKQYAEDTIRRAREQGFVQTLFGRRRRLAEIHSSNPAVRQGAERAAINMPIQGAASDILKRAMLTLEELLADGLRARQILQVHDELLLEVPPDEVAETAARVRAAMTGAARLDVPLEVKVEVGRRWGSLEAPG
ncbi:MAG: DNA polymerase I [Armatimonadetes bacterium]|nr:DNA polymerase I [Armatimonadota bacterium]